MDWVLPGGFLVAYKGVQFVMMTAFSGFRVFGFLDFLFLPPLLSFIAPFPSFHFFIFHF